MTAPAASFVVPCYKLAHLLRECVESILSQSYENFEVLIMDDCSPDHTPEVAQSFKDSRVKHIRNDQNLGHLCNYNKGIRLARGRYVWLLSADDLLGRAYVLERYVSLMDRNPRVGYAFCPAVGVKHGQETGVLAYSVHGKRDRIYRGHALLKKLLLKGNTIVAASGLVRRECYEKMGLFPLDMPYAGDWYLWCLFAVCFDVGYFAEPMVCYREHELSITHKLVGDVVARLEEGVAILWAIKRKADEEGFQGVSRECLSALSRIHSRKIAATRYGMSTPSLDLEQFEKSLCRNSIKETERNFMRARFLAEIGNEYYFQRKRLLASQYYESALSQDYRMPKVAVKRLLLALGNPGDSLRRWIKAVTRTVDF